MAACMQECWIFIVLWLCGCRLLRRVSALKHCIRWCMSANANILKLQQRGILQNVFPEARFVTSNWSFLLCFQMVSIPKETSIPTISVGHPELNVDAVFVCFYSFTETQLFASSLVTLQHFLFLLLTVFVSSYIISTQHVMTHEVKIMTNFFSIPTYSAGYNFLSAWEFFGLSWLLMSVVWLVIMCWLLPVLDNCVILVEWPVVYMDGCIMCHDIISSCQSAATCENVKQGCGLGRDVSVSRQSWDILMSRLGLVSDKILNVSVSSRSRSNMSQSRLSRSRLGSRAIASCRDVLCRPSPAYCSCS